MQARRPEGYNAGVRALLVGLDLNVASQISGALDQAWPGATISLAGTVEDAHALMAREHVDVVILGASAANGGIQLCEDVCETAPVPVLLVADRRGLIDRVRALELGISGVLWLPITDATIVEAVRVGCLDATASAELQAGSLEAGAFRIDYDARTVTVAGEPVELSPIEYRLLYHLTRNANSVLAYETLIAKVWGRRQSTDHDTLKVHIDRLSLKIPGRVQGRYAFVKRAGFGFGFAVRASLRES